MKFSQNAEAALRQSDTKAVAIEMTDELRAKYKRIACEVVDFIKPKTDGPLEAYMILQFVMQALEENCGIRGGIIVNRSDKES